MAISFGRFTIQLKLDPGCFRVFPSTPVCDQTISKATQVAQVLSFLLGFSLGFSIYVFLAEPLWALPA
ncbi:MAG: hypothetical protein NVS9B14_12230 [Candidatus Acidiferrum sp.]